MPLDLQGLTRNKPAMLGLAGAAGVGGYVWYRNRKNTATSTSTTAAQASGTSPVFDSTGTDLATAIGNLGAGLQQQLQDYATQIAQSQGVGTIPTGTTPSPLPGPPSVSVNTTHPNNVILAWAPIAGAASYDFQITGPGLNLNRQVKGSSWRVTGLRPGSQYTVRARSQNAAGGSQGSWSSFTFRTS